MCFTDDMKVFEHRCFAHFCDAFYSCIFCVTFSMDFPIVRDSQLGIPSRKHCSERTARRHYEFHENEFRCCTRGLASAGMAGY
jgi:hypothetical protein